tara:strand:- start:1957 stop:2652 length:696 start_codon:yes stop_codon:yes gene_type:complete
LFLILNRIQKIFKRVYVKCIKMITTEEMKKLEEASEVSKVQLMSNAGKGIFDVLNSRMDIKNKKVLLVCYHGNNGGDGFVAANCLCDVSDVTVLFVGDEDKFKEEGGVNYKKMLKNSKIQLLHDASDIDFGDFDYIIDAILGTGSESGLKEPIASVVDQINESGAFKIAVDVPTGMNPDTGEVVDKVVNADLVVSFHDIKKGLEGIKDKVVVVDIGIKDKVVVVDIGIKDS